MSPLPRHWGGIQDDPPDTFPCPLCHAELPEGADECPDCGVDLEDDEPRAEVEDRDPYDWTDE